MDFGEPGPRGREVQRPIPLTKNDPVDKTTTGLSYRSRYGNDAMAPLRLCLKVIQVWPENQTRLQRYISYLNLPILTFVLLPFIFWYIVVDGPKEGGISLFRGLCDFIAMVTIFFRGSLIFYHANDIFKLSELSTKGCKPYEENHKVVHIKPSRIFWCPDVAFFSQLTFSFILCTASLWDEVENRKASIPMPKYVLRTSSWFYPVQIIGIVCHIPIFFTTASSDALIVSLTTMIREKAETMKNILRDFAKIKDHSQQDAELSKVVIYHNIIATIRNETENIMTNQMLLQIPFLVLSLGSPATHFLFSGNSMSTDQQLFTMCYVLWAFSQLIVYCELCDAATNACSSLGFAAYSAYHADMAMTAARKLTTVITRAQRPMHLTARNLIKINRVTLLKICRRSYSLYSAILNTAK